MTAALGATGRFMKKRLLLTVETRQVQNEDIAYGAGVEVSPPALQRRRRASARGYRSERQNTEDASGITLGLGVGFPHWGFDLSWAPYGVLGDTFRYAFRYQF
jgi:hypothetical protein